MAAKKEIKDQPEISIEEKKVTTSKKLLFVAWGLLIILIVLDICGIDVETSLEMVGGLVTAIISSVYMWKAKAENKVKISVSMVDTLADKYGIENVIQILHDILTD